MERIISSYKRKAILFFSLKILFSSIIILGIQSCDSADEEENESDPDVEYFSMRNAFFGEIPANLKEDIEARLSKDKLQTPMSALTWKLIGPTNTGGRIVDLEMPRGDTNTIYAASASGGIFKSVDFGNSWNPIFDGQITLAMGDIEIDPNNDSTIYAGTGEPNTGGGSVTYDGNGIYKSADAGASWKQIGLKNVGAIGKVSVAKTNSKIIYVAAVGNIFQKSDSKGLYKSNDRGKTWKKVLYISDSTSVNDVAISPVDSNVVYVTTWERIARPQGRVYGGITTNLYKSVNGGSSWTKLLADDINRGKITIDIPPTNANLLYISIANKNGTLKNLQKYDGTTFTNITNGVSGATSYTWWFGGIYCDPTNDKVVYFMDFQLYKTSNGGTSWTTVANSTHVDQHAVFVHPLYTSKVVIGNDGGVYTSNNNLSGIKISKIPNAQVYDFDVYKADETFVAAAFQDNSFASTNNQKQNGWTLFGGGDGVQIRVNPTDKTETYSSQYGGLSIVTTGISSSDRFNWKCPIRLDPVNPKVIYFGTNKLYKLNPSTSKWTAISGDLTNGTGSGSGNGIFGTITSFTVAPSNNNYIYTGSDDGQVYVTKNGGTNWTKVITGLPLLWSSAIKVDYTDPKIAYACFSGYRYGVKDAHIYKTTNAGTTWTRISNDMPQVPVNDIEIDPYNANTLYLATDIGVYYSVNSGTNWLRLGTGMPNAVVTTLNYTKNTKQLYAATYGRSIYKIDVSTITSPLSIALNASTDESKDLKIYPNPATTLIHVSMPAGKNNITLNIYNSKGDKMNTQKIIAGITTKIIDISAFQQGVYILEYVNSTTSYKQKFIINR